MCLLANFLQSAMFLAGVILMVAILLRRFYRHTRGHGRSNRSGTYLERTPRPGAKKRSLSTAPSDVLQWHVEMQETARDLKAELDTKMRVLQLLIAQARTECNRLEHLLTRIGDHVPSEPTQCVPVPEVGQRWSASLADRQRRVYALADEGWNAAEISHESGMPLGDIELLLSLRHAGTETNDQP